MTFFAWNGGKEMKKMKKVSNKFAKIFLLIAIIISDLASPIKVFADTLSNETEPSVGAIRLDGKISETGSVTVTEGSLEHKGDVQITKTVTTLDATSGKYNVTFKIKGKDKEDTSTTPIYAVVVFDKSGSMNCVEYSYDWKGDRYCSNHGNKWNNAVKGAKDFASSLNKSLNSGETKYANIALVQFSGSIGEWVPGLFGMGGHYEDTAWNDANVVRKFAIADFSNINFGSADGGTNLGEGLNKALGLFTDKSNPLPEKAKKYVVVIGDGRPTYYSDANGMTQGEGSSDSDGSSEEYASKKATALKNAGVEIFSIGYDIANDAEAQRILREIASEDVVNEETGKVKVKHSVLAGEADVAAIFADLAKTISKSSAGTNATVTDNVGGKFNVVDKDGKVMTSDVLTEITEDETTILSFDIQIDPDTETGWHKTNEGFNLVYTDSNGEEQTISSTKDPEVYWKQAEYNYVVNYYKDEITGKNDSNYLGSATYKAVKGTEITENNVDKSLYMPTGYEYNKIEFGNNGETSIVITNDGTHNEINVLYTIKKFSYRVEYYKDNTLFDSKLESNIPYNTTVDSTKYYLSEENIPTGYILDTDKSDNTTYTITDNNIVIKIYYKKNIYAYTVNYYFNDVYDNTFTKTNEALYGDKLYARDFNLSSEELINKGRGDYFLNPNRPYNPEEITIDVDKNNNVINIYYVNTYLVNGSEEITKTVNTSNNKITSSNQVVNYEVNYKATIKNVNKGSVIETKIIDTLPYEIDLSKSNLTYNGNTGIYDNKTITWTFTTTSDKYYDEYIVDKTIKYQVVYTNFEEVSSKEDNTLTNTVIGITSINDNSLSNGVTAEAIVLVEVKGKLIVKYLEKDTNKELLNEKISIDKVGTNYSTNAEEIFGYNYDSVNGNENGKYSVNDTTVIYYYTKNNGEITEIETVKEGPDKVSSINGTFNYTLKGSTIVRDYVGKATLKVVDTLPYKIDENNSKLDNMCSYDGNYTITCTKEYNIKDTDYIDGEYKINEEFNLELIFIGIDKDTIVNKAKTIIDLEGNNNPGEETEKETEIEKGSLKVIYKTTDNVVLKELSETTELAGTKYSTVKESFYGYTFKENKGASVSGEYVANNTLVVYYIYTKNIGGSEEDLIKEGNYEVEGINSEFNYTIKYNAVITDYVGDATITIIDELPYKLDLSKSVFNKNVWTYDEETLTLTYTKKYNVTEKLVIDFNEELSLYYIGIDTNEVYNGVISNLTYGEVTKDSDNGVFTKVNEGNVVVKYVTVKDNSYENLIDDITLNGLVGTTYVTNEKTFDNYVLVETIGEVEGEFALEDKEVIYVYKLKELPPKTGIMIESNNTNILSLLLVAIIGLLIRKMK